MPLDNTNYTEAEEDLSFAPGHEGLRRLSKLLRREMPHGFTWDYRDVERETHCGTAGCALGLALAVWPEFREKHLSDSESNIFEMDWRAADRIFYAMGSDAYPGIKFLSIQPADVADAIDAYLAKSS